MISLDVTHLIVAAVALLAPVVLKRLQAPSAPPPPAAPALPPEIANLLPLHGMLLQVALRLLQQQPAIPPQQPPK
jgi:hypothetical protein